MTQPFDLDEARRICDAATPGPWHWWIRPKSPALLACPDHGILIVLDAARQGFNGATLRFAKRDSADKGGLLYGTDAFHRAYDRHESEFVALDNPDATFMAYARTALPAAIEEIERLRATIERYRIVLGPLQEAGLLT